MDLKYLNTFRVIAEEGSFTRAAERLGYTQSTMTFQMGQLEQALSARLFEKVGRRMVLSQAGRQLLPYVERVLEAVNQMHCFTQDLTQCRGGNHHRGGGNPAVLPTAAAAEGLSPAGAPGPAADPLHGLL